MKPEMTELLPEDEVLEMLSWAKEFLKAGENHLKQGI